MVSKLSRNLTDDLGQYPVNSENRRLRIRETTDTSNRGISQMKYPHRSITKVRSPQSLRRLSACITLVLVLFGVAAFISAAASAVHGKQVPQFGIQFFVDSG